MKSWTGGGSNQPTQAQGDRLPGGVVDAPPPPLGEAEGHDRGLQKQDHAEGEGDGNGHEEVVRKPLWGPCECCISCVSLPSFSLSRMLQMTDKQVVTEYFHNENFEGVGQGTPPPSVLLSG
jgi:hypothetical protein